MSFEGTTPQNKPDCPPTEGKQWKSFIGLPIKIGAKSRAGDSMQVTVSFLNINLQTTQKIVMNIRSEIKAVVESFFH